MALLSVTVPPNASLASSSKRMASLSKRGICDTCKASSLECSITCTSARSTASCRSSRACAKELAEPRSKLVAKQISQRRICWRNRPWCAEVWHRNWACVSQADGMLSGLMSAAGVDLGTVPLHRVLQQPFKATLTRCPIGACHPSKKRTMMHCAHLTAAWSVEIVWMCR